MFLKLTFPDHFHAIFSGLVVVVVVDLVALQLRFDLPCDFKSVALNTDIAIDIYGLILSANVSIHFTTMLCSCCRVRQIVKAKSSNCNNGEKSRPYNIYDVDCMQLRIVAFVAAPIIKTDRLTTESIDNGKK